MKIFISWSGDRSHAVAELLDEWIRCVLQATRPWLSSRDIDRGAMWFNELTEQLEQCSIAIVCLTDENKNRPWILFEAGAIMKGLRQNRVINLLIDLEPKDITDPLASFNHASANNKKEMRKLVDTLNKALNDQALDQRILDNVFETYWSFFEKTFKKIIKEHPPKEKPEPRAEADILAELLDKTRRIDSRVSQIEGRGQAFTVESSAMVIRHGPVKGLLGYTHYFVFRGGINRISAFMTSLRDRVGAWQIGDRTISGTRVDVDLDANSIPVTEVAQLAHDFGIDLKEAVANLRGST